MPVPSFNYPSTKQEKTYVVSRAEFPPLTDHQFKHNKVQCVSVATDVDDTKHEKDSYSPPSFPK